MLIDIAVKMVTPIVLGFIAGIYIDHYTKTTPILGIILGFLGMFAGIYLIYKSNFR